MACRVTISSGSFSFLRRLPFLSSAVALPSSGVGQSSRSGLPTMKPCAEILSERSRSPRRSCVWREWGRLRVCRFSTPLSALVTRISLCVSSVCSPSGRLQQNRRRGRDVWPSAQVSGRLPASPFSWRGPPLSPACIGSWNSSSASVGGQSLALRLGRIQWLRRRHSYDLW